MPVMINLTTAEHGGTSMACGTHEGCGVDCNCGCPYTGMVEKGRTELIVDVERRYPGEWLGFVIPPGEDEFAPEQGLLVVHSTDDSEVWDAITQVTFNQIVHVYYNGPLDQYMDWAEQAA